MTFRPPHLRSPYLRLRLRRLASLLAPALAACLTAACASYSLAPDPADTQGRSASGAAIELTYWHTYSDVETKVFEARVLPMFEKQHPDIAVRAVRQNYTSQLNDNIVAAVADDKQPDVMRMDIIWVPQFARSGALTDLSVMPDFADYEHRFTGALIQTNLYEGRYYGIPLDATTMVPIYDKRLLAEAGLDAPPETFDQLIAASRRLKAKDEGLYGVSVCCSSTWGMLPYFRTLGGELLGPDNERASGYLDGERSVKAMEKLKGWYDEGLISPSVVGGEPGGWDGLFDGKIMMIDEAHWFFTSNVNGSNAARLADMTTALFPSDAREGTSIIGGENLVLFKGSRHPDAAWTFMKFMVSEPVQEMMAETGLIPSIRDFDRNKLKPVYRVYLDQLARAEPRPPVPEWDEVDDVFSRMVTRVLVGEQDAAGALRESAAKIDAILAGP
ncbi:extracellular solute-binding protein [Cohnella sp. JJ-181]|uniref:extracellular solute-binding protein n=1 Tax=Cohnella rhizoplanae TaxID=2974897 RepID=UPI0022FFA2D8|nr:extracellular solute-binding protein [Cohnella sp. JJ-181]CAI6042716.1 Cyclodextrin-binding protein [Cohnella sp. JJ-181]